MPEAPDEVQMPLTSQLPPNVWLPCRTLVITLSHGFCLFLVPPTPPFNHAPSPMYHCRCLVGVVGAA
jgi:hypothetical protein